MKLNEKGITLTSLIIYVTVMSVVVAAISTITTYAYKNMNNIEEDGKYAVELNKFDMYFLQDIKKAETISQTSDNELIIRYKDEEENDYIITYEKNYDSILRAQYNIKTDTSTNINICKKVTKCYFTIIESEKKVGVYLEINNDSSLFKNMYYVADNLKDAEY